MVRNAAQKPRDGNGTATQAAPQPAPEGIDQVRDLLFGGQMRMVDARIQSLDDRFAHETTAMRTDFERKIAELDSSIKKELSRHAERLVSETTKRVDDLKALSAEMRESVKSLEKRHGNLEEAAGLADADLRDNLLKQSAAISNELARTSERITSQLDRITTQLQADKLDSSALVTGLTDLAARLGGTATAPPGKKTARS
jgi:Skp family chaperone for outer membrane proteins